MSTLSKHGRISHVIGFDDAPFDQQLRGDVLLVGAVYADRRLECIISGKVRRDGVNSTREIVRLVSESHFVRHLQLVMLQGIAFAGFNVIDIHAVYETLGIPVLVVMRRCPDLKAIEAALLQKVPGGARKWRLIQQAGSVEPVGKVFVQRAGISLARAGQVIQRFAVNSELPEPLRTAHLVAGGIVSGESRHRP